MVYHDHQCIQVHIPKTGGVTVRNMLGVSFLDKWLHIKPDHPRYRPYWNKYFTFTFVRNPWDRLVSCYFFSLKKPTGQLFNKKIYEEKPSFTAFVMDWLSSSRIDSVQRFNPQMRWITNNIGEEYRYDFIGKTEELQKGVIYVINKCGFDYGPLKQVTRMNTTEHKNFREYYTFDTYKKVARLYEEDIKRFDYTFEEYWQ